MSVDDFEPIEGDYDPDFPPLSEYRFVKQGRTHKAILNIDGKETNILVYSSNNRCVVQRWDTKVKDFVDWDLQTETPLSPTSKMLLEHALHSCQSQMEIDQYQKVDWDSAKEFKRRHKEESFSKYYPGQIKRRKILNFPPRFRKTFQKELKGWEPKFISHPLICPQPGKPKECMYDVKENKCIQPPPGRGPCRKVYNRMENRSRNLFELMEKSENPCHMFYSAAKTAKGMQINARVLREMVRAKYQELQGGKPLFYLDEFEHVDVLFDAIDHVYFEGTLRAWLVKNTKRFRINMGLFEKATGWHAQAGDDGSIDINVPAIEKNIKSNRKKNKHLLSDGIHVKDELEYMITVLTHEVAHLIANSMKCHIPSHEDIDEYHGPVWRMVSKYFFGHSDKKSTQDIPEPKRIK